MVKILITGAQGLIGSALSSFWKQRGYCICPLTRDPSSREEGAVFWDIEKKILNPATLEHFDAVIHLAGEGIATGRWTRERKERIYNSRIRGTELLCDQLSIVKHKPRVLIAASAIGYYGETGSEQAIEGDPPGQGFLSEVCTHWEAATASAAQSGIRVVNARIGAVLSANGGMLKKMLLPFKMGLGGVVGSGTQYISWIDLNDLVAAFDFSLHHEQLAGPVNFVAPYAVTNREFTKVLGQVLSRPTFLSLPAGLIRKVYGDMADSILLGSTRVMPRRLLEMDFRFRYPVLEESLSSIFKTGNYGKR